MDSIGPDDVQGLPPAVARMWNLAEPTRRGPKPRIGFDQVVGAAVTLADEEGLAGVSMAAVARRLGVATMSLYRHVDSKDQLVEAMLDAVAGEPPEIAAGGWRAYLAAWTRANRNLYVSRPWMVDVPRGAPPTGPRSIAWLDRALLALRETPLDGGEKINILTTLTGYALNEATLTVTMGRAAGSRAEAGLGEVEDYGRLLATLAARRGYSEVAQVAAGDVFVGGEDWVVDTDFTFGLELLLDGIEALVARRTG